MLVKVVFLLVCVSACVAHLCMFNPPQRGPMTGINTPRSPACNLGTAPCGGSLPSTKKVALAAGSVYAVVLMKNEDHYNPANPGYFAVSVGIEGWNGPMKELARTPDTPTPSLTVMAINVTLPAAPSVMTSLVLQTSYVTNNLTASFPVYYQCADITLVTKPPSSPLTFKH